MKKKKKNIFKEKYKMLLSLEISYDTNEEKELFDLK